MNHENLLAIRNNVLILSCIMNLNYTDQIFKFLRVKNSITLKEVFHKYAHVRAMNKPPVNSIVFETIRTLEITLMGLFPLKISLLVVETWWLSDISC